MDNTSNKSRTAALLLAFFLGAFGGHRFYAGKNGSAVAMLILSCTIIGAIITVPWAWIDIIVVLIGSFKDKEGLVIRNW